MPPLGMALSLLWSNGETWVLALFFFLFRVILSAYGSSQAAVGAAAMAYTTATATPDLSCICDLYCSLWQGQIFNPLSEARGQTHVLMDTSQVLNC